MSLGKTVITLTAIRDLKYNQFAVSKVLVIAPKRVAESTWAREAAQWEHLKLLRVVKVLGTAQQRLRALSTPADVYVINRENVPWIVEHYRNTWPFDMVVVDELSSFKSHQAKRFKALTWVRKHITRIAGLTGTPAPNGLLDLWAQLYLLDQGKRLGKSIGGFRERYFEPDQRTRDHIYSYAPKPGADERIRSLIGDICISMRADDYLDLPECIAVKVPVHLDSKAKAAYVQLEREMLLQVGDRVIDAGTAAVLTNKLLQLCNGAVYDEGRNVVEIHQAKIEAFVELVEALNGQPVLVFYGYQHDKDRILRALHGSGLRIRVLEGDKDVDAWNSRQADILLAHPASCAHGLNLQQGGNQVIWFGLNWSLELYQQANKRLHRQGQTEKVIIHHMIVEGGVDEDVMAALDDKGGTQDRLLRALQVRIYKAKQEAAK